MLSLRRELKHKYAIEYRNDWTGNYFALTNLGIKKQRQVWKLLFALYQVLNVKVIKDTLGVYVEEIYTE